MSKKQFDIKQLFPVLIPVLIAAVVTAAMAISGRVSVKMENRRTASPVQPTQAVTEQDATVKLVAVGDNYIQKYMIGAGEKEEGVYDFSSFYTNVAKYVENADIACVNQETLLGGSAFEYSGAPKYNSPWEVGEALIDVGFNVFTLATNHAMDMGSAGIEKELEFFSGHPDVVHIGTAVSEDDYDNITYMNISGITFAMLNYTYGTNGISVPEDKPYLVNILDKKKVKRDVQQAREKADVVIVFPHWGTQNSQDITEQQKKYTKLFSDLGVDIVIGTNPHVLQKVEWVENEESGKKMLVYYSLGNFISHQTNLEQLLGGMAQITVERKAGEISVTDAKLLPLVTYYEINADGYQFTVYPINDYTSGMSDRHNADKATPEYFEHLAKTVVSEEFLTLK